MQVESRQAGDCVSPTKKPPSKSVCFELLLDERLRTRARIPLRVMVNPHDTTESIVTTVKSFYGIYHDSGVSFEDAAGNTLIASYENFDNDISVYVRSIAGSSQPPTLQTQATGHNEIGHESPRKPSLGEPIQMLPPHMREHSQSPTRSAGRHGSKRSTSPSRGRGWRSASQQQRSSRPESRGSSANGSYHDDGYSDSDAGQSSVSGSKRARSEQFASSEISTANVLQDGRRGGTIFDSSTLPLFVPPQVPVTASQSSISPQRRSMPHDGQSPFAMPTQKLYDMNAPPLASPLSSALHGATVQPHGPSYRGADVLAHNHRLRARHSNTPQGHTGPGVLPTPDPTVASCISDEDVARTLIALGDASNFSHGRTSTSTMDDTFSGVADAASSTGATSDSDEYSDDLSGLPKHQKYLNDEDEEYEHDALIKSEFDDHDGPPKTKKIKTKMHDGPACWKSSTMGLKSTKPGKPRIHTLSKPSKLASNGQIKVPPTPNGQPRKTSSSSSLNFQLAADEEDLSSKPRCQRCRKSKKGCDRQRPCGRCKDAGIGIEGCVSEDEGNGRKGRYGRHMGVAIKKADGTMATEAEAMAMNAVAAPILVTTDTMLAGSPGKKRKR